MRRKFDSPLLKILLGSVNSRLILFGLISLLIITAIFATALSHSASANESLTIPPTFIDEIWQDVSSSESMLQETSRKAIATHARSLRLNPEALQNKLKQAPLELKETINETLLTIPLPDGRNAQFRLENSPVMPPVLAAKYPEIQSYRGVGIDDPSATVRCDFSPRGFHASVLLNDDFVTVQPASIADPTLYVSYFKKDYKTDALQFACEVKGDPKLQQRLSQLNSTPVSLTSGSVRRTYRIAIATTQEYTNSANLGGGTVASTMASLNTWLNGVNVIYERDLSIHLMLAANNDQVVYTAEPDPFTNGSTSTMLSQVPGALKDKIGLSSYDVGHVLGTGVGGGGVANLGVTCSADANGLKGGGVTLVNPTETPGSPFSLSTLAHEIGHQFSATHTFSASCSGNRTDATAFESASGLTLMSYAGVCDPSIVGNAALHFHSASIAQILTYVTDPTEGGSCPTNTATGNNPPSLNVGATYTIPKQTPFVLTAVGNDADVSDLQNLTYSWEEIDAGPTPPYVSAGGPLFRPFVPTKDNFRYYPSLNYILDNANMPPTLINGFQTAENLPDQARSLSYLCVVRDNRGGVAISEQAITVAGSGPLLITQPNVATTWAGNSQQTVTWSVNNTNQAPVNCQNVKITMSVDGGLTFPYTLATSTPNNGSANVNIPGGLVSSKARIKVEAVGNIFFDISDVNFSLTPGDSCTAISGISPLIGSIGSSVIISGINFTGVSAVKFANNVNATFTVNNDTQITATIPNGAVTGPITISKANCGDKQTQIFSLSSGPTYTIMADDNSIESSLRFGGTSEIYYVNRLTPTSYPATITGMSLFVTNTVPAGTDYNLLVGSNPTGASTIDAIALQKTAVKTSVNNQFVTFSVPNVTITSGDFIVGFGHVPQNGVFPLAIDTSPPIRNRSYYSGDQGNSYTLSTTQNYAIRAIVSPGSICNGPQCQATNTAPSITPAASISRLQGSAGTAATIASVSDLETAAGNLLVTASSIPTGITISNIVNSNGTITATIAAGCNAATGNNSISLTVTDDGNLTTTGNFIVNVNSNTAPTVGTYSNATVSAGSAANIIPNLAPTDNGSVASLTASAPAFGGSFAGNPTTGVVSVSNAGPAGIYTVTVTATDNCGATTTTTFQLTVGDPGLGYEADVAPRPNGSNTGAITIADWTQVGRFVAGLDTVNQGSEFQKTDCAPKATFGDGKITLADWVQAGRYAAGLDAVAVAAGPTQPVGTLSILAFKSEAGFSRTIRARSSEWNRNQINSVQVDLNAVGNENGLSFSLNFDPQLVGFIEATSNSPATITINKNAATRGIIGIVMALPAGQVFPSGTQAILDLKFIAKGGRENTITHLDFSDQLISRDLVDVAANEISGTTFYGADISINGVSTAQVSAASYNGIDAAPGSIVSTFGIDLATASASASTADLPLSLDGTTVKIIDENHHENFARLFFVSPNQVNYLVPETAAEGLGEVIITNKSGLTSRGYLNITRLSPGLFSADSTGQGLAAANVQRIRSDRSQAFENVGRYDSNQNRFVPLPIALDDPDQVFLALYGTGLRQIRASELQAQIGGIPAEIMFVGAQGFFAGLDQINLRIPKSLIGRGAVTIELTINDQRVNPVTIFIR